MTHKIARTYVKKWFKKIMTIQNVRDVKFEKDIQNEKEVSMQIKESSEEYMS